MGSYLIVDIQLQPDHASHRRLLMETMNFSWFQSIDPENRSIVVIAGVCELAWDQIDLGDSLLLRGSSINSRAVV
jgi:hypothetical protein